MATDKPRQRKRAVPPESRTLKTSLIVDVDLHARWSAAASLRGMSNNALALEILRDALRGLVIIDRRGKPAAEADLSVSEGSAA